MSPPFSRIVAFLLATLLLASGCIQTSIPPAHKLEAGETAVSASIQEPAAAYIPRLTLQASQGFGHSDVTVNVAGTVGVLGAGLNGRYYLSPNVAAEVGVQGARVLDNWHGTGIIGVRRLASNDAPVYIGAQGGVLSGKELNVTLPDDNYARHTLPMVGITTGIGHIDLGTNWRMQIELEANITVPPDGRAGNPPGHLSVAFFRLWD